MGVDILLGGNAEGTARDELRRRGIDLQDLDPALWEETLARAKATCEADRQIVLQAGGLHVIGTERYEARRIDNQLRGRSGRMGDPGSSRFYVALDDELMRRFGGSSVANIMERLGVDEDTPIEHNMVTKVIESAQVRVEGHNFDLRKNILEYDDVVNQQRQVIYDQRRLVLSDENLRPIVQEILQDELRSLVETYLAGDDEEAWDYRGLHDRNQPHDPPSCRDDRRLLAPDEASIRSPNRWKPRQSPVMTSTRMNLAAPEMRHIERLVMLRVIDNHWVHHLTALDELREGIGAARRRAAQSPGRVQT